VRLIAQLARRKELNHLIAIAICSLLLVFAVGSKVAAYHSKEQAARSIAALKVWQAKQVATGAQTAPIPVLPSAALAVVCLFFLSVAVHDLQLGRELTGFHLQSQGFSPAAVRPPPAL
jgi:hypothetical protein